MRNLVIMPAMAQNRERMNLGEYAEEATIIMNEPVKPANHFIEANTQEVTLNHLKNDALLQCSPKTMSLQSIMLSLWKQYRMQHNLSLVVKRWNRLQSEQATLLKEESQKQSNKPANQL